MRHLPIKDINIAGAIKLFETKPKIKIWRLEVDRYAITRSKRNVPVIAFDSTAFSYLINNFSSKIIDIKVIRGRDLARRISQTDFEIRIRLQDGSYYYFSSDNTVAELSEVELADRDECPAPTPCKHWNLPEETPNIYMFITYELSKQITEITSLIKVTDVVERLWLEASKARSPHRIEKAIKIQGEFLDYTVKEFRCGRMLFMAPEETSTYGD